MVVRNRCPETGNEEILVTAAKFPQRYEGPVDEQTATVGRPIVPAGWRCGSSWWLKKTGRSPSPRPGARAWWRDPATRWCRTSRFQRHIPDRQRRVRVHLRSDQRPAKQMTRNRQEPLRPRSPTGRLRSWSSDSRGPGCPRRRRHGPCRIRTSRRQRGPEPVTLSSVTVLDPAGKELTRIDGDALAAATQTLFAKTPVRRDSRIGGRLGRRRPDPAAGHRAGTGHAPDRLHPRGGLASSP